ncbi:MAG: biotin transporter BioY [Pelosinus sp.]|nr:biotin transporter BioY [Pelosinus sp.]
MNLTLREMILVALFAALTAIGAFIQIPTPIVPYTLQFLFCAYSGILLGAKKGLYSQLLYVGIGLLGIPIFVNGGGPTYVLQPTFGFLLGFILCAYVIGKATEKFQASLSFAKLLSSILLGLFIVYLFGVSYLYAIVNLYLHKEMAIMQAIAVGFTPYILPDIILSIIIAYTATRIIPILRRRGLVT